ncbi:hypothetical protein PsorP6_011681 [Peronosclerospora sorghi]|uniref:Uncharacterized protein n=1 Tax=Peronosclerospora sorghi TaxID=230839 RepID=A0ACC0WJ10_9STRA|nr:hypothetical protein PsorP6_011681 [Peronosclerospora sorghi]
MTKIAAYHAIPEQDKPVSWTREGALESPYACAFAQESVNMRTPVPGGSTYEALMDIDDAMEASVRVDTAVMSQNRSEALPKKGFPTRLFPQFVFYMTFTYERHGIAGIVGFWESNAIGYGGVIADDVSYATAFQRAKTTECLTGTDYGGDCDVIVVYAMLVYHVAPLMVILRLIYQCLSRFDGYQKESAPSENSRLVVFLFCELINVVVLILQRRVDFILYFPSHFIRVVCRRDIIAYFVELTCFARFRKYLSVQLGAFKETDQTGGIQWRLVTWDQVQVGTLACYK